MSDDDKMQKVSAIVRGDEVYVRVVDVVANAREAARLCQEAADEFEDDVELATDDFIKVAGYLFGAECFTEFADNFDIMAMGVLAEDE